MTKRSGVLSVAAWGGGVQVLGSGAHAVFSSASGGADRASAVWFLRIRAEMQVLARLRRNQPVIDDADDGGAELLGRAAHVDRRRDGTGGDAGFNPGHDVAPTAFVDLGHHVLQFGIRPDRFEPQDVERADRILALGDEAVMGVGSGNDGSEPDLAGGGLTQGLEPGTPDGAKHESEQAILVAKR